MNWVIRSAVALSLLTWIASSQETPAGLVSDLESWHRLKRQAGYFTESHRYKGGLYKNVRHEYEVVYGCRRSYNHHCVAWAQLDFVDTQVNATHCRCLNEDRTPYCAAWLCGECDIESDGLSVDRSRADVALSNIRLYVCEVESPSGRYCHEWRMAETVSDAERGRRLCLMEDQSRSFCLRWKEAVETNDDVKSTVCQCQKQTTHYCSRWTCRERRLLKCKAHRLGWCSFDYGFYLGGLIGGAAVLLAFRSALPIHGAQARLRFFSLIVVFGCFPWSIGVVIWGGLETLCYVLLLWAATIITGAFLLYIIPSNCLATRATA